MSISIGTVASQVFLSDQLCPALILQVLKARNVPYQLYTLLECILNLAFDEDTHKPGELTLREKQAIWMLKEKRK